MTADYDVSPEPSPEERDAIIAALERDLHEQRALPAPFTSLWWQAGVRENAGDR